MGEVIAPMHYTHICNCLIYSLWHRLLSVLQGKLSWKSGVALITSVLSFPPKIAWEWRTRQLTSGIQFWKPGVSGSSPEIDCPMCQSEHSWVIRMHFIGRYGLTSPCRAVWSVGAENSPLPWHTFAAISRQILYDMLSWHKLIWTALPCPVPQGPGENGKHWKFKLNNILLMRSCELQIKR